MKYTHVIWDFNGTILDDVSIGIEAINSMLSSRGMPIIENAEHYRQLFGFPIKDYYGRCGFDFEKEDYESVLAPEWIREYNCREHASSLSEGVGEALELFKNSGIRQSILSASNADMLSAQIDRLGIGGYFEQVIGCDNYFAYGKTQQCMSFVSEHPDEKFILVGDSTHDAEVARAAGIDCALVLSGHMNIQALEKCGFKLYDNPLVFAKYILKNQ